MPGKRGGFNQGSRAAEQGAGQREVLGGVGADMLWGTGAAGRPEAERSGVADQDVRVSGGVVLSGRMRGDIAAAPASTGAVRVCSAASST